MFNFILKNFTNPKLGEADLKSQHGQVAAITGLFVNVILATTKIIIGLLNNSVSILGDGLNNLTDSISSVLSIASFRISGKEADSEHPYGHARVEYIASAAVALIIAYVGISLAIASVKKILSPEVASYDVLSLGVLIFSIVMKLWLYRFYTFVSDNIGSDLLKATAMDSLSDVLSTGAVLVSVVITFLTGVNLDGWMGLVVSLIIMKAAIEILRDAYNSILGVKVDDEQFEEIMGAILESDDVLGAHDLTFHEYGNSKRYLTVDVDLDGQMTIADGHKIVSHIERKLLERYGVRATIHIDPDIQRTEEEERLYQMVEKTVKEFDHNFIVNDFYVYKQTPNHRAHIDFDLIIPSDYHVRAEDLKERINKHLMERDPAYQYHILMHRKIFPKI